MKVTVTKYLNVRAGSPSVNAPNFEYLVPGSIVETDGKLYEGDFYEGDNYWYKDAAGNYYWSGGVEAPTRLVDRTRLIVDLHCHPSLKPYNNAPKYDIWRKFQNPELKNLFNKTLKDFFIRITGKLKKQLDEYATYTQSNLEACFKGRNRLIFTSIYPVERPFVRPDRPFTNPELTPKQRRNFKQLFGIGDKTDLTAEQRLIQIMTGFSAATAKRYVDEIQNDDAQIDYFEDFIGEYHTLKRAQESTHAIMSLGLKARFKLVNSYAEIEALRTNEIAAIVNIEGAHALGTYLSKDLRTIGSIDDLPLDKKTKLEQTMLDRIAIIKGKGEYRYQNQPFLIEHTPFYLTLSHHFNNLVSGHAESFKGFAIFNQEKGLNGPLTATGERLIRALLSRENGRRILIDTKHMSIETRRVYHKMALESDVPIICSHTAVNGLRNYQEAIDNRNSERDDSTSYISRMDINLTDEDIREIYDSKGLIGVCMHDGRMPGGKFKKAIKEAQGPFDNVRIARVNRLYAQLFLMNVFHIVKVNMKHIKKRNKDNNENIDLITAWDTLSLGTDYDGIIDPFNHLTTAASLEDFKVICINSLEFRDSDIDERKDSKIRLINHKDTSPYDKKVFDELMMGMSPREAMDKVFSLNVLEFLKKYFNDGYLTQKT